MIAGRIYGALEVFILFNDKWTTKVLKLLLSVVLGVLIFPYFHFNLVANGISIKILLLCKEIIIGAILGYIFSFPFWVIQNVGNIIDMQRGEQFGAIVNQTTNTPSSSIGDLLLQGYLAYIVSINGVIFFFQMVFASFKLIGINVFFANNFIFNDYNVFIDFFAKYFYWVVVLVLPIIACMFLLDMVFGVIGSFVPAMNISVLSMPIKCVLALFLLTFYVDTLYHVDTMKFYQKIRIYFQPS